ncbi:phage integrase N-terminal SAM-like domain-containing protein [Paenibacillus gallinarum]|uniref:phage integrase N-terminal SAM-like domain-containing protein n=1 Tax=Paenibacillus gallinarum TaxID=2762232 RepID=UPI001CD86D83|nr:phage integrase N-terminal SAM-like domain-containing protein [Paenibacillus gallinarum]
MDYAEVFEQYDHEIRLFIAYMKDREYSKETQKGYLHDVKHFLISLDGKSVKEVTDIDVMYYLTEVREKGAGPRYRNRFISQRRGRISKRMVQTIAEKTFTALLEQYPQFAGKRLSACSFFTIPRF